MDKTRLYLKYTLKNFETPIHWLGGPLPKIRVWDVLATFVCYDVYVMFEDTLA